MSKEAGQVVSTNLTQPPKFQQPSIEKMLSEANRLYQLPGPSPYPGSTVAEFSPLEQQGQQALANYAQSAGQDFLNQTFNKYSDILSGQYGPFNNPLAERALAFSLNPGLNPYLGEVAQNIRDYTFQGLTNQVLPKIRSSAQRSGTYGGSRQGIAEGLAIGEASRGVSDAISNLYSQAYGQGLQAFTSLYPQLYGQGLSAVLNTMEQAPALFAVGTQPGLLLANIGSQQRALEQAKLNELANKYAYEQNLPYVKLAEFANMIRGPFGGESVTTNVYPEVDDISQIGQGITSLLPFIKQILDLF